MATRKVLFMWANYRTAANLLGHACWLISCLGHVSPVPVSSTNALNFCITFIYPSHSHTQYWQQVCPETEIIEYFSSYPPTCRTHHQSARCDSCCYVSDFDWAPKCINKFPYLPYEFSIIASHSMSFQLRKYFTAASN